MLPIDLSKAKQLSKAEKYPYCEFGEIYLIFNHKNIWVNMQNADPTKIKYELHDDLKWLPYVHDDIYPYKWDVDDPNENDTENDVLKFKLWQKYVDTGVVGSFEDLENKNDPRRMKLNLKLIDFRIKGEFMQPFQPFYGPKERLPPLSRTEILAKEKLLTDNIEQAMR